MTLTIEKSLINIVENLNIIFIFSMYNSNGLTLNKNIYE